MERDLTNAITFCFYQYFKVFLFGNNYQNSALQLLYFV